MLMGRQTTLRPSREQIQALGRACGAYRWAWNWGLEQKQKAWAARKVAIASGVDPKDAPRVPNAIELSRMLTLLKKKSVEEGGVPWLYETTKCAPVEALRDLDRAFEAFFRRLKAGEKPGYPRFKSKMRGHGHFAIQGAARGEILVEQSRIRLPRIGWIRLMPGCRGYIPDGVYGMAYIKEHGGQWLISVRCDREEAVPDPSRPTVAIDAGVRELAHLSDGTVVPNPMTTVREAKRLRKARLSVARKQRAIDKRLGTCRKGERREYSKRLQLARRTEARIIARVANIRKDALHKVTTALARKYSVVVVEDLHGKNMTRRCHGKGRAAKAALNRAILDSGMLRLRSLLAYKMPLNGGKLVVVPAAYTSQTCSRCGERNDPGSSKTYRCAKCGLVADRDHNASLNILAAASCSAATADRPSSRGADVSPKAKAGRRSAIIRQREGGIATSLGNDGEGILVFNRG
jgi:putative transposase